MKKLLITCSALLASLLPSLGQVDHDYNVNDLIPVVSISLTKDKVPPAVVKSVSTNFAMNNPVTWTKFPYALKEYGWVYDIGASDINLDHWQVIMKTKGNSELSAIYSSTGELLQTREVMANALVPSYVKEDLANSQYKDWTIVGSKEIIKYYHDHDAKNVEQHFRLTVEKGKARRSLSFNYKGTANN